MKFKNTFLKFMILLLYIIPITTFAYSDYVIVGGETIGIEVHSKGVLVVGFYKLDNKFNAKEAGFSIGDSIIKVNDTTINTIDEMINTIGDKKNIEFTILSDNKEKKINLDLIEDDNGVLKTGL